MTAARASRVPLEWVSTKSASLRAHSVATLLHTRRRELEDETGTGKKTAGDVHTRDIPGEPGRKRDTRAHIEMVEYGYTVTHKVSGRGEGGMSGTLSCAGPRRIFARASVLITLTKKIFNRPQKLYRNYRNFNCTTSALVY